MGRALTCLGGSLYRVLMGKDEGRRKLIRPRHRREGNIKMYINKIRWGVCEPDLSGTGQGQMPGCSEQGKCNLSFHEMVNNFLNI